MATVTGWHAHDGTDMTGATMPTVGQTVTHSYSGGSWVKNTHWTVEGLYACTTLNRLFLASNAVARGTIVDKVSWDDATDQVYSEGSKVALTSRTIDQRVDIATLILDRVTTKALALISANWADRPQSVVDYLNSPSVGTAAATRAEIEALLNDLPVEKRQAAFAARICTDNNGTRLLPELMIKGMCYPFPEMASPFVTAVAAEFT